MPHEFSENDAPPQTRSSSGRSGGPPHKHTGIGVLDSPDYDNSSSLPQRWSIRFTALFIVAVVAVMLLVALFLNR